MSVAIGVAGVVLYCRRIASHCGGAPCCPSKLAFTLRQGIANLHRPPSDARRDTRPGFGAFLLSTVFPFSPSVAPHRNHGSLGTGNLLFFDVQDNRPHHLIR